MVGGRVMAYRVLDLFSGIGGFSLGLERTGGFQTVAFCEIEPFPRKVVAKHWPGVPIYSDVKDLTIDRLNDDGIAVDVICGGFPCQDISFAGKGAGIEGERSGLWSELCRLIGEVRPRYGILENVSALLGRGLGRVLGDLAEIGFDAEWHCIPAAAIGAPHRRDRIWIVAYPASERCRETGANFERSKEWPAGGRDALADATSCGQSTDRHEQSAHSGWAEAGRAQFEGIARGFWDVEPDVGRVAHGVPARVDRLKGLGNAVVPQVVELIGKEILASESELDRHAAEC